MVLKSSSEYCNQGLISTARVPVTGSMLRTSTSILSLIHSSNSANTSKGAIGQLTNPRSGRIKVWCLAVTIDKAERCWYRNGDNGGRCKHAKSNVNNALFAGTCIFGETEAVDGGPGKPHVGPGEM